MLGIIYIEVKRGGNDDRYRISPMSKQTIKTNN